MMDFEGEVVSEIRFFHISTDGKRAGVVYFDENDYRYATIISAVAAYLCGVRILSYCHMSSHSHFVVCCETKDMADLFINKFKHDYSKYAFNKYGVRRIYRGINSDPRPIGDFIHLKRCISYVLLNPVEAKICSSPENYKWSSFKSYFTPFPYNGCPVSSMLDKDIRSIFKTRSKIEGSGFVLDKDNCLEPKSFVSYKLVESIYRTQKGMFYSLSNTDSAAEELNYVPHTVEYNDNEIIAEAMSIAMKIFKTNNLVLLTKAQKLQLIRPLRWKTKASDKRIARILRLNPQEVSLFTGRK